MRRICPLVFICWFMIVAFSSAEVDGNREFCRQTVLVACDSLLDRLALMMPDSVSLEIAVDVDRLLHGSLTERLYQRGVTVFLEERSYRHLLAALEDIELDYTGVGGGLFSGGEVERKCSVELSGRLLGEEGRLLRLANVETYRQTEVLDFAEAESARNGNGIFAPDMPPSVLQRVVEPALIITITGALVYLFFASR